MNTGKRATIREVSEYSGVSIATVSRVIHQNGRFSVETEKRVRDAMAALHYEPDVIARGMRMQAMPTVGVIVPDILDDSMALMMRTVQQCLFAYDYSTVFFNSSENGEESQRFIDSMYAQRAAGLIYIPDSQCNHVALHDIPTVFFDRAPACMPDSPACIIQQNNAECAAEVANWLLKLGKRKIAIVGDKHGISAHRDRVNGMTDMLRQNNVTPAAIIQVDSQRTTETVNEFGRLLDSGIALDAVFCTSIRSTVGAMSALKMRDITQDQIRVAGFGVHRLYQYGLIDYLAVYEPILNMAKAASDTLVRLIRGDPNFPKQQVFPAECIYHREDVTKMFQRDT